MTGLYGLLHGQNPHAMTLLAMLGLSFEEVGRFRDCYLNAEGDAIIVYTRNGGGNREEYAEVLAALAAHPCYVQDWDDDYDSTYAYIEFTVPPECRETAKALATGEAPQTVHQKFEASIRSLRDRIGPGDQEPAG